ncbi:MAG: Uma2 family endonuclease, partial [Blastocatellia bacterium]
PEYFWFDPHSYDWAGFEMIDGKYQRIEPDQNGRLVSHRLGLALARREGSYQGYGGTWLRWETPDGELLLTGEERAVVAQQETAAAKRKTKVAKREAEASRLRVGELEAMLAKYQQQFGKLPE